MSIKIKPLRKFTTGTPTTSNMEVGEIAVNTADKKIYMRDDSGGAGSIVEVGASSELFTGGATTNIDINGRVTADEFRFKDSNTLLVSADYTGSSYLVQNEIQEILSITPDGNSQNYSIFGTISAASGANVHTLHINANLRSNTLPDLTFTQTYNEDLSVANTRYITPILFTKETATASMKLCVKIEAQIFGIVTANLVIIARSNDQLENVTVNTTEASEFTGTPTGFTERSFTRTYVVNAGSYELQSSNATKIIADSLGITTTGRMKTNSGALGGSAGDTVDLLDLNSTVSNGSRLKVFTERDTAGTDWTTSFTRIQQIIDVTEMGYIQFNGDGNTYGMELGTNGDEKFIQMVRNAQVELYWNGNKKFETASNGVTITGKLNGLTLPTGSGTLAKTSDITGIASVSADTNPSLGGTLDTAGNNITFGDSASASDDRLQLGSDQDLSIYHDGTDAYVSNKTGDLYIGANDAGDVGGDIYIRAKIGENDTSIQLLDDSSARIYVNGSLSATFASSNIQAHTGKISIEDIGANGTPTLNFNKGSPNTIDLVGVSTGARTINLPDASGTLALTSNLSSYAPISSPTFTGTVTSPLLRLTDTTDVNPSSTGHAFQIGATNSTNIAIDTNEIMARNNGSTSILYLNPEGSAVVMGGGLHLGGATSTQQITFEGTDDAFEIFLKAEDATVSDKTITLPNETGTVVLGTTLFPSGTTTVGLPSPGAINLANPPENDNHVFHPFLHNDLGHFVERGGSYAWGGLSSNPSADATKTIFNASGDFCTINDSNISGSTYTLTLTDLPKGLSYSAYAGIVFCHDTFSPGSMVIETSTNNGSSWTTRLNDSSSKVVYACTFDTGGTATNAIRFTLTASPGAAQVRIQSIAAYNYNSAGMENYFLPLDGGTVYGDIHTTGSINLGHASDTTLSRSAAGKVTIEGAEILTQNSSIADLSNVTLSGISDGQVLKWNNNLSRFEPGADASGGGSSAADDITIGDAEVEIATSTGQITIDNQASDQDIVFKGNDSGSAFTALTLDMSDAGTAIFNHDIMLGTSSHYLTLDRGQTTITAYNNALKLNSAGGVQIQRSGSTKITTTTTGADVTGVLTNDGIRTDGTISSNAIMNQYGSSSNPIVFTVTVGSQTTAHPYYNDGSTNKYLIDGVQGAALTLHGVDTMTSNSEYYYRFDQSDSSNANHPLRFYYESNKTTLYTANVTTNGTPGQSGAYTEIAVNKDTPKTLYYQCSQHSFMGNYVTVPNSRNFGKNNTLKLETDSDIRFQHISNAHTTTLDFELPSSDHTITIPQGNTGTLIHTGNSDLPTTTTSSGDADFVLIDDGGTMKKITPANLGIGGGSSFNGTLTSTDAGGLANPVLTLDRNSASPTSGDVLGEVQFKGRNDAGETITYGSMGVKIEDASDATEDSRLIYKIQRAGELKTVLDIKANQFKVNNVSEVFFGDPISALKFEGATGDPYELTLAITDPTGSDKTVTIPDATGTILTTGNSDEPATTTSSGDADFVLIDDGGTMKKISPANLGIGGGGGGSNQNAFSKFNVSGQSAVEADAVQDQVTLVGAGGISITTNAGADTITFTGSGGGSGVSEEQAIAFAVALG